MDVYPLERVDKFVQEVCWRTYWKGWLQIRPSVWSDYKAELDGLITQLEKDGSLRARYTQAIDGETGIDCFDAWAGELMHHGYLHNHARMWFASIWIFTLKLPWALGADFFLRHLLDGDAASNTLSWRWVAGLQTAGKNYLARADNIEKFTDGRFSPKGLAQDAAPLTSINLAPPPIDPLTGFDEMSEQFEPETMLFVTHEDDCGFRPSIAPKHSVVLDASQHISPLETAPEKLAFTDSALGEGARVTCSEQIIEHAQQRDLKHIVLSRPCVGPVAHALVDLCALAKTNGLSVGVHTHEWDRVAWPKATKGFFAFKKSIPDLLALDLPQTG